MRAKPALPGFFDRGSTNRLRSYVACIMQLLALSCCILDALAQRRHRPEGAFQTTAMSELGKLIRYKACANDLLFEAVATMPEAALVAPQPIVFGSLARTLNHLLAMDHVWQSHLRGAPHDLKTRNPDSCPAFAQIAQAQKEMDRWYIEYVEALTPAGRDEIVEFMFIGGGPGSMTRADILLHVVNHGTYHRGHIAQMMRGSQSPPITDYPVFLKSIRA
jgi:uncharacterized damage-inducible protein DinB